MKARFQALVAPSYVAKVHRSRARGTETESNGCQKKYNYDYMLERWQGDEAYRDSQLKIN